MSATPTEPCRLDSRGWCNCALHRTCESRIAAARAEGEAAGRVWMAEEAADLLERMAGSSRVRYLAEKPGSEEQASYNQTKTATLVVAAERVRALAGSAKAEPRVVPEDLAKLAKLNAECAESVREDEQLRADLGLPAQPQPDVAKAERPLDLAEWAWLIIANAWEGDWTRASADWQTAAAAWRERYHEALGLKRGGA